MHNGWYHAENGDSVRPAAVDTTSSRVYVYMRKNITFVEETGEGTELRPAHYEWQERAVPKGMWDTESEVLEHGDALSDIYDAITELVEIVEG